MSTSRIAASGGDALAEPLERLLAVACELDLVPLELERALEGFAHCALVVDHEDLHRTELCARERAEAGRLSDFLAAY